MSLGAEIGLGPLYEVAVASKDGTTDRRPKCSLLAGSQGTYGAIDTIVTEQVGEIQYDEAVLDTGV